MGGGLGAGKWHARATKLQKADYMRCLVCMHKCFLRAFAGTLDC